MSLGVLHFVFWALRQLTAKGTKDISFGNCGRICQSPQKSDVGGDSLKNSLALLVGGRADHENIRPAPVA